jgi:hypothetical protein
LHRRGVGTLTKASGNAQRRSRDHGCIGRFAVQEFRFSATSPTNYAKDPYRCAITRGFNLGIGRRRGLRAYFAISVTGLSLRPIISVGAASSFGALNTTTDPRLFSLGALPAGNRVRGRIGEPLT